MSEYRVQMRDIHYDFETYEDAQEFASEAQDVNPTTKILQWDWQQWVVISVDSKLK